MQQKKGLGLLSSLFKHEPAPLIGIDISSSAIKLVELGQNGQGAWILERFASEPLAAECVVDGNIEKFDEVTQALERLVRRSGTRAKHVALALPNSAVITKRISLPGNLSELELEVQVESEAHQYLPFPLEEVSLDFCIIGPNAKAPDQVDVLLAATRKEKVQERNDLAIMAGLQPVVMDVESYAARLAASPWLASLSQADSKPVALIRLGASSFGVQIVRGDEVLYELEQTSGGLQLTQMIAHHYDLSLEQAERKKTSGDLPDTYEEFVLQPFITRLAQDVGRALQFFFSSTSYNHIEQIAIFGGTACIPQLAHAIARHTGVAVSVLNPFEGMHCMEGVSPGQVNSHAPLYLTACGLAMRRFLP